jgi:hypothetical protein
MAKTLQPQVTVSLIHQLFKEHDFNQKLEELAKEFTVFFQQKDSSGAKQEQFQALFTKLMLNEALELDNTVALEVKTAINYLVELKSKQAQVNCQLAEIKSKFVNFFVSTDKNGTKFAIFNQYLNKVLHTEKFEFSSDTPREVQAAVQYIQNVKNHLTKVVSHTVLPVDPVTKTLHGLHVQVSELQQETLANVQNLEHAYKDFLQAEAKSLQITDVSKLSIEQAEQKLQQDEDKLNLVEQQLTEINKPFFDLKNAHEHLAKQLSGKQKIANDFSHTQNDFQQKVASQSEQLNRIQAEPRADFALEKIANAADKPQPVKGWFNTTHTQAELQYDQALSQLTQELGNLAQTRQKNYNAQKNSLASAVTSNSQPNYSKSFEQVNKDLKNSKDHLCSLVEQDHGLQSKAEAVIKTKQTELATAKNCLQQRKVEQLASIKSKLQTYLNARGPEAATPWYSYITSLLSKEDLRGEKVTAVKNCMQTLDQASDQASISKALVDLKAQHDNLIKCPMSLFSRFRKGQLGKTLDELSAELQNKNFSATPH